MGVGDVGDRGALDMAGRKKLMVTMHRSHECA
ncbi:hypothetical protein PC116_g19927 [Phytophthora cactorum]|nr:hypothetical protein PC116_g19927 [Phytophthora cactorum]